MTTTAPTVVKCAWPGCTAVTKCEWWQSSMCDAHRADHFGEKPPAPYPVSRTDDGHVNDFRDFYFTRDW